MRRFIAMLLLAAAFSAAAKDDNFVLRAYVTRADTSDWVALDSVAVMISAVDDTVTVPFKLVAGNREAQLTDGDGEIRALVTGKPGKYMLTLDREGYEPYVKEFERKYRDQTTVWVGNLAMKRERIRQLNEVEVTATAIKMVMNGDTVVYNADAFNLAEGSMLESLVRQLPNAQINTAGEITVNGRKINSLLINGKDFFAGDMEVAMKNLPSYTVKNIKVYDKAGDDDYLTQASQKLDRKEDQENLVMDVVLKKEYSIGMMASVEGGYGTDNRYMGRVFGMGFTETARISVFGNFNNLNDMSSPSERGDYWYSSSYGNGDARVEKGGLDYNYEPKGDKLRVYGNLTAERTRWDLEREQAQTLFFPGSSDLYRRMASRSMSDNTAVRTNHTVTVKHDVVYLSIRPEFSWKRDRSDELSRQATFNANPVEAGRTEALDSVFARPGSRRFNDILLTRLRSASVSETNAVNGRLSLSGTLRFKEVPGRFNVYLGGNYDRSTTRKDQIYGQNFGGANTSGSTPTNNERFDDQTPETGKFSATAGYSRDWSNVGEKISRKVNFNLSTGYHFTHTAHDYNLFATDLDSLTAETALPSLSASPMMIQDLLNSYNSINNDHNIDSNASLSFATEAVERTDSGLNPEFRASIGLDHKFRSNSLDYNTDLPTHESVLRRTNSFSPTASLNFSSSNKMSYRYINLFYRLSTSQPGLNLFLHHRNTGNPLVVYEYNAHNLRQSKTHRVDLRFYSYGRKQRYSFHVYGGYELTQDAIGNASTYDPQTGVTTYKPMNINGNWSVYGNIYSYYSFGKDKQISLNADVSTRYQHSVDFLTAATNPERSLVKDLNMHGSAGSSYTFGNGSVVEANFSAEWISAHSDRVDFNTISAMEYSAGIGGMVKMPWEIELRTRLNVDWKRGYEVAEMNREQWLWNAEMQKSIMKGNLTFKVKARDILGQIRNYSMRVNAQGRYETWTNTLGRYVLVSVIYRFNKSPKKRD